LNYYINEFIGFDFELLNLGRFILLTDVDELDAGVVG